MKVHSLHVYPLKSGRVIDSIRTLLQVRAAKDGKRVELELLEADELR